MLVPRFWKKTDEQMRLKVFSDKNPIAGLSSVEIFKDVCSSKGVPRSIALQWF